MVLIERDVVRGRYDAWKLTAYRFLSLQKGLRTCVPFCDGTPPSLRRVVGDDRGGVRRDDGTTGEVSIATGSGAGLTAQLRDRPACNAGSFARLPETCGDWFNLPRAIDYFILAELEKRQLKPIGPATRPDLLRRATFGLTGLPPTPEEMDDFLRDDQEGNEAVRSPLATFASIAQV